MNCNVAAMLRATIYHSWLPPAELRLNRASGETRECSAYFCSVADEALNDAANRSDTRSRRARPRKGACSVAFKGNARTKEWEDGAGHLSANTLSGCRGVPPEGASSPGSGKRPRLACSAGKRSEQRRRDIPCLAASPALRPEEHR